MGLGLGISGGALPRLYREAQLCLLAARPVGYTTGQRWHNHGTTGTSCDAWPVSVTQDDYLTPGETFQADNGDHLAGPGFVVVAGQTGPFADRTFEIAGSPITPANDTVGFTCTIALTPIYINPSGLRFFWKYRCTSLPPSPAGLVIENVDNVPVLGEGNYLPAAVYNGTDPPTNPPCSTPFTEGDFLGGRAENDFLEHTRQVLTFRYDPIQGRQASGWRSGSEFFSAAIGNLSGPWLDANNVYIGSGQICHAVLWHDRPLSDSEIQFLHARLG